jgi:hypothetical protein
LALESIPENKVFIAKECDQSFKIPELRVLPLKIDRFLTKYLIGQRHMKCIGGGD